MTGLSDVLAKYDRRPLPGRAREFEIVRMAGRLGPGVKEDLAARAKSAVLRWAQKRRGGRLPPAAWQGLDFEHLEGGRNCIAVAISNPDVDLWAFRADDPDKSMPGRVWTTEVVIGFLADDDPRLSVRLFAVSNEEHLEIEAASPGFIRQIIKDTELYIGALRCSDHAWWLTGENDVSELIEQLANLSRRLPFIVVTTGPAGWDESLLPFNPDELASAMAGLAHIAVLPEQLTWKLSETLGRPLSVFDGGIRVYQPGFTVDDDAYGPHDLILAKEISTPDRAFAGLRWLRNRLAASSVRREGLGDRTISFEDVRNASIAQTQLNLRDRGAGSDEQLIAAQQRITSLETTRRREAEWTELLESDNARLNRENSGLETAVATSAMRISQLEAALRNRGAVDTPAEPNPTDYAEVLGWCERNLPRRLIFTPSGRRAVKAAEFDGVDQVVRCLVWLATDYRDARIHGGDAARPDAVIEPGIRNAPCGGDSYEISLNGRTIAVDSHVKGGGNTRDPRRCLRIYHGWDDGGQVVVVDHLPSHRETGAS